MPENAINWFEIPVTDLQRAKRFYGAVLAAELHEEAMDGYHMAIFPSQAKGVGGSLTLGKDYVPTAQGQIVYLNVGADIDDCLSRVETAGGKIAMPKTLLPNDIGHIAMLIDSEGNRVGLHAPPA